VGNLVSQAADAPYTVRLSQLITGFRITQAIYVAAELGIADLLAIAPRPVEELARVTGTHAPSLGRLLMMLASTCHSHEPSRSAATPGVCRAGDSLY
jgi:Dimerisation domain